MRDDFESACKHIGGNFNTFKSPYDTSLSSPSRYHFASDIPTCWFNSGFSIELNEENNSVVFKYKRNTLKIPHVISVEGKNKLSGDLTAMDIVNENESLHPVCSIFKERRVTRNKEGKDLYWVYCDGDMKFHTDFLH